MKKIFTFILGLTLVGTLSAQVPFWTEGFNNGCTANCFTYTGPNGAWTFTNSSPTVDVCGGTVTPNGWRISCAENGGAIGSGHAGCGGNATLHISNDPNSPSAGFFCPSGDCGATYDAGGYCGSFGLDNGSVYTDVMAQSPVINCTGKSTITLAFQYREGGDGTNDDATLWYYDGATWSQIDPLAKQTKWTAFSMTLPVSANNNAGVKIGFRWVNDDDQAGNDPSFAVDSITLSVTGGTALPPTAKITASDSVGCNPLCINFSDNSTNNPTSWLWTFTGAATTTSTAQNPGLICYPTPGVFSVKLKVSNSSGTDSVTLGSFVHVNMSPPTPTISQTGNVLSSTTDATYTSYQWYDGTTLIPGATDSSYTITHSGPYTVKVFNENGCSEIATVNATFTGIQNYFIGNQVSIFPSPATSELTVTGNWLSATATLSIYDIIGKKISESVVKLDNKITVNVKNLTQGVYLMKIENTKGRWTGKFVKE